MITISQGDELTLTLTCTNHDLTGATLTTKLKASDCTDVEIANSAHTINPNQVTNKGKFTVNLTAADTAKLQTGEGLSIITKIVQSGKTIHFHGIGVLNVRKSTFVGTCR